MIKRKKRIWKRYRTRKRGGQYYWVGRKKMKRKNYGMGWDIEAARKRFSKAELIEMKPREFLDIALPLYDIDRKGRPVYGYTGRRLTPQEEEDFLSKPGIKDNDEWRTGTLSELGQLIKSDDVKVTVPYLTTKGEHEGRHRAKAAELAGLKTMPVSIVERF